MPRTDSLEKTLMLAKIKVGRKGQQRLRSLDGITDAINMSLSRELVMNRGYSPWGHKESDTTERLFFAEIRTCDFKLASVFSALRLDS